MRLGISSYTFNWWAGVPGYPLPGAPLTPMRLLEEAAARQMSVVQIADNLPLDGLSTAELGALAARARQLDIALEAGSCGIREPVLQRYLEICRAIGSRFLRTLIDSGSDRPQEAEAIRLLREMAPRFEQAGVILGIENHDRLPARALRRIIDATRSRAIGACLDTANSLGAGEDIGTVLDALVEITVNVHIKDFAVRRLPHGKGFLVTGTPAGKGRLDIPSLLSRLRAAGRDVSCILELWSEPAATLEESIAVEKRWADESLEYLRNLIPPPRTHEVRTTFTP